MDWFGLDTNTLFPEYLQIKMATASSIKSHCMDIHLCVWPEDGSNDPSEEATEVSWWHVAAVRIS